MFTLLAALVGYGLLAEYSICLPYLSNCSLSKDWLEFGLINAVPLPGLDKYAEDIRAKLFVLNDNGNSYSTKIIFYFGFFSNRLSFTQFVQNEVKIPI
jgi:hypothetical protein